MLSLHSLVTLATWAIGIFGVGGAVAIAAACVFFGPTVVISIVQPILTRFLQCTRCVVTAVFIVATVGAYWLGHHDAAKECRAGELEAALRNARIDAQTARAAKADETKRADDIEQKAKDRHEQDKAYIALLQKRPGCLFDDSDVGDDARRLRFRPRSGGPHPAAAAR